MTRRLCVGLDAVAGLRERAGGPSLAAVAALASVAGAASVRLGVREEDEPAAARELRELSAVGVPLELRMAPIPALLKIALEARPARVLLASNPNGGTHQALPLDFRAWGSALAPALRTLEEAGLTAGALVAPELSAVKAAHAVGAPALELYTGSLVDLPGPEGREALARLADAARLAGKLRLEVGLGGGLDETSVATTLTTVPSAAAVAVGRAWVSRSVLIGVDRATRDLREAVREPRG
jgi:pyridoxine 5-phosphate synthase